MTLDDISCKIACTDLMVRLCDLLDKGENVAAAGLFSEEAELLAPNGNVLRGAEVRAFLENRSPAIATRHVLSNVLITPGGPDTATVRAYILVYRVPRQEPDALPRALPATPQAVGDWDMDLVRTSNGWRIRRFSALPVLEPTSG